MPRYWRRAALRRGIYKTFQAIAAPRTNSANARNVESSVLSNIVVEPPNSWARGGSDGRPTRREEPLRPHGIP